MWFSFSSAVKCPPVLDPLQAPQPIVEEASVDIDISGLFLDIGAELFLILGKKKVVLFPEMRVTKKKSHPAGRKIFFFSNFGLFLLP